jgi:hypothetical protein
MPRSQQQGCYPSRKADTLTQKRSLIPPSHSESLVAFSRTNRTVPDYGIYGIYAGHMAGG